MPQIVSSFYYYFKKRKIKPYTEKNDDIAWWL